MTYLVDFSWRGDLRSDIRKTYYYLVNIII